ncbi:MAG: hypothetical protein J0I32_04730 [Sphingobacteriales bacterium]|nr:hypothetical protein [Sphingobacteriales bacterium]OJV98465.1 MAG: hypothetical protein BGO52_11810 [Sphingobacteriales bacterium 44-61]
MNTFKQFFLIIATAMFAASCVKVNFDDETGGSGGGTNPDDPNVSRILVGSYERDITLDGGTYTIKGYVYFTSGTTLKIPEGTILKSDVSQKGALIFERGAKIDAQGSAAKPIVFTSGKAAGSRGRGDWGGVILLGNGPTNRPLSPAPLVEGGVDRRYGGTNATDNSGIMRYCRIEFAGVASEPGSEINGLTLGGVGSGTTLEYIQVSYGNDDSFEFFGGTVNAKFLVCYATSDDDLDFDFGYTGKIQFSVIQRRPEVADTDAGNGVEADNDGSGTLALPYTKPTLSNITWIGPNGAPNTEANLNFANRWRRSVRFEVHNSILMGYPKGGFSMESAATGDAYNTDASVFKNNLVHALADAYKVDAAAGAVITAAQVKAKAEANGCITYPSANDIMLEAPFNLDAPNYMPKTGSPALTGAVFTGLDPFFTSVTYRGAFGTTNWTSGWTSFSPQTNVY